ncbi:alpha/beta hydrolase [Sharpea azabuensis]|uniref:alpha/beta hydrolase n=1 Tax=Sharpea azabuensis TaxID=322505 RepID=UPI0023F33BAB|nr:alpha/beta hydrolase [Sharpea azabuensis]
MRKKRGMKMVKGLLFFVAFGLGIASKFVIKPSWAKKYDVKWSEKIGIRKLDLSYGEKKANKFDLYLPKDDTRKNYGLVVYLHAGGFTSGDKKDDEKTLAWPTSKGYVAAGINYTLRTETNDASVLSQSYEIKKAIPEVVEQAKKAGYNINKMAVAGGSAGHTLAMIYAYRDGKDADVPVVMTYGDGGPSSFHVEDWSKFGISRNTDESRKVGAALFTVMSGQMITLEEIQNQSYLQKVKAIAAEWVKNNPIPTVVAYGAHDRIQPFAASKRLEKA